MWLDFVWAALSVLAAFYLRSPDFFWPENVHATLIYAAIGLAAAIPTFLMLGTDSAMSRYFSIRDAYLLTVASAVTAGLTSFIQFMMFRLDDIPRSLPVLHAIVLAAGLILGRLVARQRSLRRSQQEDTDGATENVIIVGATRLAWFYLRTIDEIAPRSRRVVAIVDRRERLRGRAIAGRPVIGPVEGISRLVDEYGVHGVDIHRIVIADARRLLSDSALNEIDEVASARGIAVQSLNDALFLPRPELASTIVISRSPTVEAERVEIARRSYWAAKRILDIGAAGLLLVILTPVALLTLPVTILDVGLPLMFWQSRIGRNGRPISIYKFRTLRNPIGRNGERLPDDRRISVAGRMVRSSRIDEIPQLISVIQGDMSLVGPRPLLPIDQPGEIGLRLMVAPGLTGWAQVNGGKLISSFEKNALDEWYVRHASLWLDLWIMLRTPLVMIIGDRRNEDAIARALDEQRTMFCCSSPSAAVGAVQSAAGHLAIGALRGNGLQIAGGPQGVEPMVEPRAEPTATGSLRRAIGGAAIHEAPACTFGAGQPAPAPTAALA